MGILTQTQITQAITEINEGAEKSRRAEMHRRHRIYLDGGKQYLIEQLIREFSPDAVKEMRLSPVNFLKKIVNKKSTIYKEAPFRKTESASDQALLDYYVEALDVNGVMQKGNRYYNLFANCAIYTRPCENKIEVKVVPPYLYSLIANALDLTKIEGYIFSDFYEEGQINPETDLPSATGAEGFSRSRGLKVLNDQIASGEAQANPENRSYILWTDEQHMTLNSKGIPIKLDPASGEEQFLNPVGQMTIVNLAQERDNTPWALQGADMVDVCIAIQLGLSDLLSIAKHQGFSLLSIVSEEEPQNLKIGLNRAIWLKATEGQPTPSIAYVQASSPLDQYKAIILDLVALLLSTNDMSVNAIGGANQTKTVTSGFQALIEMSDTLDVIEQQKPIMKKAEKELWDHIKAWHNYLYENDLLDEEVRKLGVFSDDFEIQINYRDMKPIESEQERVNTVKELMSLHLLTRKDAVKKLNPDLSDEQIEEKLQELDQENPDVQNKELMDGMKTIEDQSKQDTKALDDELFKQMQNADQATQEKIEKILSSYNSEA